MNLETLRYFVIICECGSYSQAAKETFLTRQALRQRIHQLENELGGALFSTPAGKNLEMTEMGAIVLEESRNILKAHDRMTQRLNEYRNDKQDTIQLLISIGQSHLYLDEFVSFSERYPNVHVVFQEMDDASVLRMYEMNQKDYDFIITNAYKSDVSPYSHILLHEYPFVLAFHPSCSLSGKESLSPRDLEGIPFVYPVEDKIFTPLLLEECRRLSVSLIEVPVDTLQEDYLYKIMVKKKGCSICGPNSLKNPVLEGMCIKPLQIDLGGLASYIVYNRNHCRDSAKRLIKQLSEHRDAIFHYIEQF